MAHRRLQAVAEGLAQQVGDLRYNHAVQRITWSGGPGGGISIACSNGATLEADAAIVTVSLGVLKAQHEGMFQPPLPPCKAAAIRRLRIGVVDKLLLDFARPGQAATALNGSSNVTGGGGSSEGPAEGTAGTAADPVPAPGPAPGSPGSTVPAVSYALLWSSPWEGWGSGSGGASAGGAVAAKAELAAAAAVEVAEEAGVLDWARGIFSLRFGGPECKVAAASQQLGESQGCQANKGGGSSSSSQEQEPAAGDEEPKEDAASADDGNGEQEGEEEEEEFSPCAEAAQPTCYQAVAWVTGEAAAAMEAASDEEVLGALRQLAAIFPQMQLPPGASWDAFTLHR